MIQALSFFIDSFSNYNMGDDIKDLNRLREVCLSLGKSWDAVVAGWQNSFAQNGTTAVFGEEVTWVVTTINSLVGVRRCLTATRANPDLVCFSCIRRTRTPKRSICSTSTYQVSRLRAFKTG